MTMRMLHAGGIPIFADNQSSFESNHVNGLPHEWEWLCDADGKAVKILEPQHLTPPSDKGFTYSFIWTRRNFYEQAKSQTKFLRYVAGVPVRDEYIDECRKSIKRDTPRVQSLLCAYPGARFMEVGFENTLVNPRHTAERMAEFLAVPFDVARAVAVVEKRQHNCLPGFMELKYVNT